MIAFRHGVASADPLPDGVLLWTRCTTDGDGPVEVDWWVSATPERSATVASGPVEASPVRDFTVHVDVGGLAPATTYWYGFEAGGVPSPVGRTRTAPAADSPTEHLRIGLVSCACWPCGYFNAYGNLARRDVDLVVHAGDYLYEHGQARGHVGPVRAHVPAGTLVTLGDYRRRHAQYKTDPDLQALHARHPMVAVWDDHELAGGAWRDGAAAHVPRRHGPWAARRAAAVQAYFEWMPVRALGDGLVHRTIRLGPLADLLMLDTRLTGRDRPEADGSHAVGRVKYGARSLLGADQWRWLEREVAASSGRWTLLGNQVMLAPLVAVALGGGRGVNPGQWDGYRAERSQLYEVLAGAGHGGNVVVLTGDLHSSWAADLPVGAEVVGPSVTSDSFARTVLPHLPGAATAATRLFLSQNSHLRVAELTRHGYVVVDLSPVRVQADWWHVDTIARRDPGERWFGGWQLADGRLGLRRAPAPA